MAENRDLVDSDLGDPVQGTMLQTVVHHEGHGPTHAIPSCPEDPGCSAPGESPGPTSEKELVVVGQMLFPRSPGKSFDMDSMERTIYPAGSQKQKTLKSKKGRYWKVRAG